MLNSLAMDARNIFVLIFLAGTFFSLILEMILELTDFSFRKKHGRQIPEILKDHLDSETLNKTCLYEDAKFKLWIPSILLEVLLSLYLVFS